MTAQRIYPVPVKRPSAIGNWTGWPDDVRPTLWDWNHGSRHSRHVSRLTFTRSSHVYKCADCEAFCRAHKHGAAVLDGAWLCDDCLIARARSSPAK